MSILKIARMGHPVLKAEAAPVENTTAPEMTTLVANMNETMEDANGTGLAAPQGHVPLRVVVCKVSPASAKEEEDDEGEEGRAADGADQPGNRAAQR